LLKDYDLQIQYHPGKVNVVVDALSKKTRHMLDTIVVTQLSLLKELKNLGVQLASHGQTSAQLSGLTL